MEPSHRSRSWVVIDDRYRKSVLADGQGSIPVACVGWMKILVSL
jgi:hypothetical protein